jgi:dihydroorotase
VTQASPSPNILALTRPDDWHVHLRDGDTMASVLPDTARQFQRALVMPNLKPAVTTTAQALAYRRRIVAALPPGSAFEPWMSLYLTDQTTAREVQAAKASGVVLAVKYYPAGATTNSDSGVTDFARVYPALEAMQKLSLPLCVHGEVTDSDVDVFDRERIFLDRVLTRIVRDFPALRIIVEHATTRDAVEFVMQAPPHVGATITAQHLLYNRNALFRGGLRPHYFCLPVLKREEHRAALVVAATSGSPKFFLGTDSAPHARHAKEASCCGAGCYTAHNALELYAEAFEQASSLHRLEAFASFHGADFYGLPRNSEQVVLHRESWTVPEELSFGGHTVVPLRAGEELRWRLR